MTLATSPEMQELLCNKLMKKQVLDRREWIHLGLCSFVHIQLHQGNMNLYCLPLNLIMLLYKKKHETMISWMTWTMKHLILQCMLWRLLKCSPERQEISSLLAIKCIGSFLSCMGGWLAGQSQAGHHVMGSLNGLADENLTVISETGNYATSSIVPPNNGESRGIGRSGLHYRSSRSQTSAIGSTDTPHTQPVSRIQPELTTSIAAAAAELPCTVKLRIWSHDAKNPCARLDAERCCLTIPHAVLCSEMGAHFSSCGRFLAACVACIMPYLEADLGLPGQVHHDNAGTATSPTRHPFLAHQVMYELRIYSLEEATFGSVLASRAIRAAHCLTSIQFSPTSKHILLAYGCRHSSLLKSIVIDRETTIPIYTILEVCKVSDMELVRVVPSAEDEVNVACFHPSAGGGLVYGTKEGKLRILRYDVSHSVDLMSSFPDKRMLDVEAVINVPAHALEC